MKTISNIRNYLFLLTVGFSFVSCNHSTNPFNNSIDQLNYISNNVEFVTYNQIDSSVIINAANQLQNNYARILNDMAVNDIPKITIKIWGNYSHFISEMEKDIGVVYSGATGYIFSPTELRVYNNSNVVNTIVHEFIHIVSIYLNPTIPNNPRWLWETIALYENHEFVNPNTIYYLLDGRFPSLNELNSDFNTNKKIYEVGYLLGEFIVEKYGRELFLKLIRTNGNITSTFDISESEFEDHWETFVLTKYF